MKKWLLILLTAAAPLYAANEVSVQGKVGFFYPSDSDFQDIYGGGFIYGAEVDWRYIPMFDLYADAMYFSKGGKSLGKERHTRIKLLPVSLGLKVSVPLPGMEVYFGVAAKHFNLKIHNDSPYVSRNVTKNGFGWGAKAGVTVCLPCNFFFDIFLEYMRKKFDFNSSKRVITHVDVDVGGGVIGGSIGYRF